MHELKKRLYRESKKFISKKLYELHSKPFFTHKNFFCMCLSSLFAKNSHFHKPKGFLFQKTLRTVRKSRFFYVQKAFYSHKLSLFLPKITLFCPPPSLPTTLNLLFAKNTAILLISALILCCKAGASHRFKSLPAIPSEVAAFCKTGYLMKAGHFRKNTVSTGDLNRPRSPEVRKPLACFLVLFARRKKNVKTSPLQGASRFSKPRISTPQPQLRTATIKTFLWELRGLANLKSAHLNNNFPLTKLNPFEKFRGFVNLDLA